MKKYTFWRNSIVSESFYVEAVNEEEAREKLDNCDYESQVTEFIDWASDTFELEYIEELDPLYRMVKDYKPVDKLDQGCYTIETE
jgi:DNA-dependent RNA polymerase auxiliary subunit epsilon